MPTIGEFSVEGIFSHTPPNETAAIIIPADRQHEMENQMQRLLGHGLDRRFTAAHPETGEQIVAVTPLPPGRVRMVLESGIRDGERFGAVFHVVEKKYRGQLRKEMWLVGARKLTTLAVA
jgi:hypothetical protein